MNPHFWADSIPIENHPLFVPDPSPSSVIGNFPVFYPHLQAPISSGLHQHRALEVPIAASHECTTLDPVPFLEETLFEKRIQHYSSLQTILLVGEGGFSFSSALATTFGSSQNMLATSLDSEEKLLCQYQAASSNLSNLKRRVTLVLHGVDATCMAAQKLLRLMFFDRVVFNFPHAGFHGPEDDKKVIKLHRRLVKGFFFNASKLLRRSGEIHVSHKVTGPYLKWKLEKQAAKSGLVLKECCEFDKSKYPGYVNRLGDGPKCGHTFRLGECRTFKFVLSPLLYKPPPPMPKSGVLQDSAYTVQQKRMLTELRIYPFLRAAYPTAETPVLHEGAAFYLLALATMAFLFAYPRKFHLPSSLFPSPAVYL